MAHGKLEAFLLCSIGATILIVSWFILAGPGPRWQYQVLAIPDEAFAATMEALGRDGWELVTARRASDGDRSSPVFSYEVILKRRLSWLNSDSNVAAMTAADPEDLVILDIGEGKRIHKPGCGRIARSQGSSSRDDAIAQGFVPHDCLN